MKSTSGSVYLTIKTQTLWQDEVLFYTGGSWHITYMTYRTNGIQHKAKHRQKQGMHKRMCEKETKD